MREELVKILDEADKAYNDKQYQESIDLVTKYFLESRGTTPDLNGRAQARVGWCLYYLGLQDNPRRQEGIIDNPDNLLEAIKVWKNVLEYEINPKIRLSVLNGLPLALRFFNKPATYQWSDLGIQEAEAAGDDSLVIKAKNTKIVLLREDGKYAEARELAEEVYTLAVGIRDFRTAGHAKQNLGDTIRLELKNTQKTEAEKRFLLVEAFQAYKIAEMKYNFFEAETGEKATAHIEAAQKKSGECMKEIKSLEEN